MSVKNGKFKAIYWPPVTKSSKELYGETLTHVVEKVAKDFGYISDVYIKNSRGFDRMTAPQVLNKLIKEGNFIKPVYDKR